MGTILLRPVCLPVGRVQMDGRVAVFAAVRVSRSAGSDCVVHLERCGDRDRSAVSKREECMGWVIALVIIVAVVALDVAMLHGAKPDAPQAARYTRPISPFTPTEQSFLRILDEIVGEKARVFAKVRLAEIVAPVAGMTGGDRNEVQHKLNDAHLDFLLCKRDDLSVICAVTLEDGARFLMGQARSATFVREVCHTAGVPLVHIPAGLASTFDEVRKLLVPHLVAARPPA